ncbi:IS256 family transposase, partial [Rhodococcus rhodochrous]
MTTAHNIDLHQLVEDRLTGASPDLLRELLTLFIHALMGAEADVLCGAGYGQRTDDRVNSRNGYRHRDFDTRVGTLDVAIPKLRSGSYFPDWLLERRKRAERALTTVVATCYLLGVSTRRMEKLVETLGITSLSKSQVSVMAKELDEQVEAFRSRPLDAGPYTFVAADALVLKVRENGRVVNVHALVAVGVNADGYREILGIDVTSAEAGVGWLTFFRGLVARGLSGVRLVTSDAHAGLVAAIGATLPGASWQRCRTHCDCKELMCRFGCVALLLWYRGEQGGGGAVADGCRQRGVAVLFEQWPHVEQRIADGAGADLEQLGQDSAGAQAPQVQHSGQDTFGIGDLLKEDSAAAPGHPFAAALGVAASFDHGGLPNGEAFDEFVQLPATHAGQSRMRQCFGE